MRRKYHLICLILLLLYSINAHSQDYYTSEKFRLEVKQLDEFFDRFDTSDIRNKKNNAEIRTKAIYNLLNIEYYRQSLSDTIYKEFVREVIKNKVKIAYTDSNWYAVANCKITYRNKKHDINLTLKMNGNNEKGYKWLICGVETKIFEGGLTKERGQETSRTYDSTKFISPGDNELNFMNLRKAFADYKNFENYIIDTRIKNQGTRIKNQDTRHEHQDTRIKNQDTRQKYEENKDLELLIYAVKNKELTFNYTNFIIYHFLEIKNWIVVVKNYNRAEYNTGWLISDIIRANNTQKQEYKLIKLGIRN